MPARRASEMEQLAPSRTSNSDLELSDSESQESLSQERYSNHYERRKFSAASQQRRERSISSSLSFDPLSAKLPWAQQGGFHASARFKKLICLSFAVIVGFIFIFVASMSLAPQKRMVSQTAGPIANGGLSKNVSASHLTQEHPQAGPGVTMGSCTTWPKDYRPHKAQDPEPLSSTRSQISNAPTGMKTVGLIFYGRARYIDILDCYLRRNLKVNGGVLDEVQFIIHTDKTDDLEYLTKLIQSEPHYYKSVDPPGHCLGGEYGCIWEAATDENTLYIKMDDDISYIHDDAIRSLVQARIDNPEAWGISANIVNTPTMTYLHYFSGAIHAFLPELSFTSQRQRPTWRSSELPAHRDEVGMQTTAAKITSPYSGHRWRPVKGARTLLQNKSPIGQSIFMEGVRFYDAFFSHWSPAAQQHYSLLQNIEDDNMHKYWFGKDSGLYDTQFIRYNLNFIALWGKDIKSQLPIFNDDEHAMTVQIPQDTGRPHMIDLGAVVAHFQFNPQAEGILQTDLLDRYRAYANEMVCKADNQKGPRDPVCPGFS